MAVILALLSALGLGVGDYAGGTASKRTPVLTVIAGSHLLGLLLTLCLAPILAEAFAWSDLGIGAGAGIFGLGGVALLYRGLAIGPMSVVAPLTAVTSAAVPALWGVATGERPTLLVGLGLAVGVLAIVLVSSSPPSSSVRDGVATSYEGHGVAQGESGLGTTEFGTIFSALAAGFCFGVLLVGFDFAGDETAPWPVVGARMCTTSLLVVVISLRPERFFAPAGSRGMVALAGVCDVLGNVALLLAIGTGLLSVVAVLSALYPVATVSLARVVDNERMSVTQIIGFAAAIGATVMIAVG